MSLRARLQHLVSGPGGAAEVLVLAYPLILSYMSFTVQTFVDRVFLSWYSSEAMAGAVTGLFSTLAIMGLFTATGEYLTTFIAQYHGAGRNERIGPCVWQGIYFSMFAGLVIATLIPAAGWFFSLAGHDPRLQAYEVTYARILLAGTFPVVLMATLSTFFSGRGETRIVLWVNLLATLVNVVLDYAWIFGRWGFPRAGVAGAAWATVISQIVGAVCYLALIQRTEHRMAYRTLAGWRLEPELLRRLLRFGLPSGLQFSLEIFAFALFLMLLGRIGPVPLAASGIAFSLNGIVFVPMLGLGVGVSSVVGRYLGSDRPDLAERSTWSAFWMSLAYMLLCGALYLFAPRFLLLPYAVGADPATFPAVAEVAVVLLRFVALYSIFDMMNVIFAAGLKGAGDTVYPLVLTVGLSWVVMLVPAYVACVRGGAGPYVAWTTASGYVVFLGLLMLRRFRGGRWKSLRVIEPHVPELDTIVPGAEPA